MKPLCDAEYGKCGKHAAFKVSWLDWGSAWLLYCEEHAERYAKIDGFELKELK